MENVSLAYDLLAGGLGNMDIITIAVAVLLFLTFPFWLPVVAMWAFAATLVVCVAVIAYSPAIWVYFERSEAGGIAVGLILTLVYGLIRPSIEVHQKREKARKHFPKGNFPKDEEDVGTEKQDGALLFRPEE